MMKRDSVYIPEFDKFPNRASVEYVDPFFNILLRFTLFCCCFTSSTNQESFCKDAFQKILDDTTINQMHGFDEKARHHVELEYNATVTPLPQNPALLRVLKTTSSWFVTVLNRLK